MRTRRTEGKGERERPRFELQYVEFVLLGDRGAVEEGAADGS